MQPSIKICSLDSMFDTPVHVCVVGLLPFQLVSLHALSTTDHGHIYESAAQYVADKMGCIDLEKDASIGGSYRGIEPMGLFWSMDPSEKAHVEYFAKVDVTSPMVVTINLYNHAIYSVDHLTSLRSKNQLDFHKQAQLKINRWFMSPGTKRVVLTVKNDGLHGALFLPPGEGPFPGVITLSGNYRGTIESKAALSASHGFAALALAYFGAPGLQKDIVLPDKKARLNLEYFETAVQYLLSRNDVKQDCGIGLIGVSLSSMIVLAIADCIKNIKCVVWVCGFIFPFFMDFVYKDKVYTPEPYNFVHMQPKPIPLPYRNTCYPYDESRQPINPGAVIKFYEHHEIAYLFIGGTDDENIPSEYHLNTAVNLLKQAKHPNFEAVRYPGAGHHIDLPFGIHNWSTVLRKTMPLKLKWGGSKIPHCKSQEKAWSKQLQFLKLQLTAPGRRAKL